MVALRGAFHCDTLQSVLVEQVEAEGLAIHGQGLNTSAITIVDRRRPDVRAGIHKAARARW